MKYKIITILIIATSYLQTNAQRRAGILDTNEQSVGISTGLDYSILPVAVSYNRGFNLFNYKFPLNAGIDVTIPTSSFDFNDIRIRLISETTLLRANNFEIRGGFDPVFINLKMDTETMSSLGMDFHIFTGVTNERWNYGLDFNYNKIFSTYITHTDIYKDNVFEDVKDGWYRGTASNIKIGFLLNRRVKKFDLFFKAGYSTTSKFNMYLFVPNMYSNIGVRFIF